MVDARGKKLGSHVVETNGKALIEFWSDVVILIVVGE